MSIRKSIVAATIAALMSAGTARAAQSTLNSQSRLIGHQQVAMTATSAPTQFRSVSAACPPSTPQPTVATQGASRSNIPPTFTPWLNINNGQ